MEGGDNQSALLPADIDVRRDFDSIFEAGRVVGRGKFSTVVRAVRRHDGLIVAAKRIAWDAAAPDPSALENLLREVRLVRALDHGNVIRFFGAFIEEEKADSPRELVLVFEYADAGDLKRQLRKARERCTPFDETLIWRYFTQLVNGVAHMHARRIIHRDLKPANVFLTTAGVVKLGDLGLGRLLPSVDHLEARSRVGTPLYMAPEVLRGDPHGGPADVWSLGCILYELAALRSPFKEEGLSLPTLFARVQAGDYPPIPPAPRRSAALVSLVDAMLRQDPASRPDIEGVRAAAHRALSAMASPASPRTPQPHQLLGPMLASPLGASSALQSASGGGELGVSSSGQRGASQSAPPSAQGASTALSDTWTSSPRMPQRAGAAGKAPASLHGREDCTDAEPSAAPQSRAFTRPASASPAVLSQMPAPLQAAGMVHTAARSQSAKPAGKAEAGRPSPAAVGIALRKFSFVSAGSTSSGSSAGAGSMASSVTFGGHGSSATGPEVAYGMDAVFASQSRAGAVGHKLVAVIANDAPLASKPLPWVPEALPVQHLLKPQPELALTAGGGSVCADDQEGRGGGPPLVVAMMARRPGSAARVGGGGAEALHAPVGAARSGGDVGGRTLPLPPQPASQTATTTATPTGRGGSVASVVQPPGPSADRSRQPPLPTTPAPAPGAGSPHAAGPRPAALHPAAAISLLHANALLLEHMHRLRLSDPLAVEAGGDSAALTHAVSNPAFFAVPALPRGVSASARCGAWLHSLSGALRACGEGPLAAQAGELATGVVSELVPPGPALETAVADVMAKQLAPAALAHPSSIDAASAAFGHGPWLLSVLLYVCDTAFARGAGASPPTAGSRGAALAADAADTEGGDDEGGDDADYWPADDDHEVADDGVGADAFVPDEVTGSGAGYATVEGVRKGPLDPPAAPGALLPPIQPTVDPQVWRAEWERLGPRLAAIDRDASLAADAQGTGTGAQRSAGQPSSNFGSPAKSHASQWRQHLAAARASLQAVTASSQDGDGAAGGLHSALAGLARACAASAESTRLGEARLDAQIKVAASGAPAPAAAKLLREYRDAHMRLQGAKAAMAARQARIAELTSQYHSLGERADEVADAIAAKTAALSGTRQLTELRGALVALRQESQLLDVRLGLLAHSVMQGRLREDTAAAAQGGRGAAHRQRRHSDAGQLGAEDTLGASVASLESLLGRTMGSELSSSA